MALKTIILTWATTSSQLYATAAVSDGSCASCGAEAEDFEEDSDAQVLLATRAHVTQPWRWGQRPDDVVPSSKSDPGYPEAYGKSLPITDPLPNPNPADNPLFANYTPQDCTESGTWRFFSNLAGLWKGNQGLSFISLPQAPGKSKFEPFIVQVNRLAENYSFFPTGEVLNRGYKNGVQASPTQQSDQVFRGVEYIRNIRGMDLNVIMHKENGFYLHQSCRPKVKGTDWDVMRMGSIPHGSQPMGFGSMLVVMQTPAKDYYVQMLLRLRDSFDFSVQPWMPGCGQRKQQQQAQSNGKKYGSGPCCLPRKYMIGNNACPETGCPEPIDMLIQEAKDLNVVNYEEIVLSSNSPKGGGVQNTPFVNIEVEVDSKSFRNRFWHLTVKRDDGSTYHVLQYIEFVEFKFFRPPNFFLPWQGCPLVQWPHVIANTLIK